MNWRRQPRRAPHRQTGKQFCVVIWCPEHHRPLGGEWMCKAHWSLVPKVWKKRLKLFKKEQRADLVATMWRRIKAFVIEREAGIS